MYEVTIRRLEVVDPISPFERAVGAAVSFGIVFYCFGVLVSTGAESRMWAFVYGLGIPVAIAIIAAMVSITMSYVAYGLRLFLGKRMLSKKGWRRYASMVGVYLTRPWEWHKGLYED